MGSCSSTLYLKPTVAKDDSLHRRPKGKELTDVARLYIALRLRKIAVAAHLRLARYRVHHEDDSAKFEHFQSNIEALVFSIVKGVAFSNSATIAPDRPPLASDKVNVQTFPDLLYCRHHVQRLPLRLYFMKQRLRPTISSKSGEVVLRAEFAPGHRMCLVNNGHTPGQPVFVNS